MRPLTIPTGCLLVLGCVLSGRPRLAQADEPRKPASKEKPTAKFLANPFDLPKGTQSESVEEARRKMFEAQKKSRDAALERLMKDRKANESRPDKPMYSTLVTPDQSKALYAVLDNWAVQLLTPHVFDKATEVTQEFVATAAAIDSIELQFDRRKVAEGEYDEGYLRLRHVPSGKLVIDSGFIINYWGIATMKASSPVPVQPGEMYRLELGRKEKDQKWPLKCYKTRTNQIPFGHFSWRDDRGRWRTLDGLESECDLALKIVGRDFLTPPAAPEPEERALLVLLDVDGLREQVAGLFDLILVAFQGKEVPVYPTLAMRRQESLREVFYANQAKLESWAYLAYPLPEKWANYKRDDFLEDPPELRAIEDERARKVRALLPTLCNERNWIYKPHDVTDLRTAALKQLEKGLTTDEIKAAAQGKYDAVVVLEKDDFRAENVLKTIGELAPRYRLDIHVVAAGNLEGILTPKDASGQRSQLNRSNFFLPLYQVYLWGELPLCLRTVYLCSSFGDSLSSEWRTLGAKYVYGARKQNFLPHQYVTFLDLWLKRDLEKGDKYFDTAREAQRQAVSWAEMVSEFAKSHPELLKD